MSDPFISIQSSDRAIQQKLKSLQAKIKDLTPAMKNIGEVLLDSTDQRFANEKDPDGRPWTPNTPYTISQKKILKRIQKVLQSTGRGRASISYRATPISVAVGTNVPYMVKHQLGQGVPRREFLGISKKDEAEIAIVLDEFLGES